MATPIGELPREPDIIASSTPTTTALAVRPSADLVPSSETYRVVAAPRPFSTERIDLQLPEGGTLLDVIKAAGIPAGCDARVFVGDRLVPREWWPRVRPRKDSVVTIRAVAMGGGGGGAQGEDRNKTLRAVLFIVVAIVAIVLTAASAGAATPILWLVAAAAVSVLGTLHSSSLFPPEGLPVQC
jgi:hypothetical protein